MITVTSQAVEKLKEALEGEGENGSALRVIVVPNGHGAQYMLTVEKEIRNDDIVLPYDGIRVVVDSDSAPLLEGAEIDYVEGLMRSGFVISNPNFAAGEGCACGGNCACGGH